MLFDMILGTIEHTQIVVHSYKKVFDLSIGAFYVLFKDWLLANIFLYDFSKICSLNDANAWCIYFRQTEIILPLVISWT